MRLTAACFPIALTALTACAPSPTSLPTQEQIEEERTELIRSQGFQTVVTSDGQRYSVATSELSVAFSVRCQHPDTTPACDEFDRYTWSVSIETEGNVGVEFRHKDILNTDRLGAISCIRPDGEPWVCYTNDAEFR